MRVVDVFLWGSWQCSSPGFSCLGCELAGCKLGEARDTASGFCSKISFIDPCSLSTSSSMTSAIANRSRLRASCNNFVSTCVIY